MRHGEGRIICNPYFLKPGVNVAKKQLKRSKKIISVWCVDTKEELNDFLARGAKIIISNKVDMILNFLEYTLAIIDEKKAQK